MLPQWIIIGGILFWSLLAVLSVVIVISVHDHIEGFALSVAGLFIVACILFGNLYPWAKANVSVLIWYAIAYPLIGVAWSFPRWLLFLDKIKREYKARLAKFGELSKDRWDKWEDEVSGCYLFYSVGLVFKGDTGKLTPPQFQDHKGRITGWMLLWPWSMIDALLGELVFRFFRWMRDSLKRFYQAISDKMFLDIQ